jgi:cytochrome c biogenesis protein CcmG, thiol:disulfide interchange protein DsbE
LRSVADNDKFKNRINMKFILSSVLACALTVFSMFSMALTVGEAAPAFELIGDTALIKLSAFKGKVVYVDFWASWCGPCKQSFPWLNAMQSKYGAKGFQVVGVNVDAKTEEAKTFLNDVPAKFIVAYDDKGVTPKQFGIKGMPSSVLIDANGKVIYLHTGFRDSDKAQLEQSIQQALSAK